MQKLAVEPDTEIAFRIDDFTDPWRDPETVILVHGVAESSVAWFAWVPHLARRYRVVRFDLRGHGESSAMPIDYPWSLDRLAADLLALADNLGLSRFHLVAAKVGGMMALHFAARHSDRLSSLTVLGTPIEGGTSRQAGYSGDEIEQHGVEHWARRTMAGRLGTGLPPEAHEWWARMMGRTPRTTQAGFLRFLVGVDVRPDLPSITCPVLVVTTGSADNYAQNITDVETVRAWQTTIPHSRLLVLPGDSFHVAATDADRAAEATAQFIRQHETASQPA